MTRAEFEARLRADGFTEINVKSKPAQSANADHQHAFDMWGMVIKGEMIIASRGRSTSYRQGEMFFVAAGETHSESFPRPADVLVGCKV